MLFPYEILYICMNENSKLKTYLELEFICKTLQFFSFFNFSCFVFHHCLLFVNIRAPAAICWPISSKRSAEASRASTLPVASDWSVDGTTLLLWNADQSDEPATQRRPKSTVLENCAKSNVKGMWWSKTVNKTAKSKQKQFFKNFVKLKLLVINDTPKFHLRSLGSVNFIDMWLDPEMWNGSCHVSMIHLKSIYTP